MNNVVLVGRLTRDPAVSMVNTKNGQMMAVRFNLAVDRQFKTENQQADFIPCKAFGKTAEFINNYFKQGMKMGLQGSIQTGSYTNKDGQTVYTVDVLANNVEFVEKKQDTTTATAPAAPTDNAPAGNSQTTDFMNIPDTIDDEGLPFK